MKKVIWQKSTDDESEYKYVGNGPIFEKQIAIEVISSNFKDGKMFLVLHRNTSVEIDIKEVANELQRLKETQNVIITDRAFRIFIEFNSVGSYRLGCFPSAD